MQTFYYLKNYGNSINRQLWICPYNNTRLNTSNRITVGISFRKCIVKKKIYQEKDVFKNRTFSSICNYVKFKQQSARPSTRVDSSVVIRIRQKIKRASTLGEQRGLRSFSLIFLLIFVYSYCAHWRALLLVKLKKKERTTVILQYGV